MTKKAAAFLLKLVISGTLLFFILQGSDFSQVAKRLELVTVGPLLAAVACLALQAIAIATWRWHAILRLLDQSVGWVKQVGGLAVPLYGDDVK